MAEGPSLQDFKYQLAHIHDDRRRQVVALNATLLVLGSITVVLRLIGRKLQGAQLKIDDFLMVLAVVCHVLFSTGWDEAREADTFDRLSHVLSV